MAIFWGSNEHHASHYNIFHWYYYSHLIINKQKLPKFIILMNVFFPPLADWSHTLPIVHFVSIRKKLLSSKRGHIATKEWKYSGSIREGEDMSSSLDQETFTGIRAPPSRGSLAQKLPYTNFKITKFVCFL